MAIKINGSDVIDNNRNVVDVKSITVNAGIVTASVGIVTYYGDGSKLTRLNTIVNSLIFGL